MKIGDDNASVEFELIESIPDDLPRGGDIACSVEARCGNFQGSVSRVWFDRDDLRRFVAELIEFEETRRGSVSLLNMSSLSEYSPLTFEIRSIDTVGHLLGKAELSRLNHYALKVHRLPAD